MASETKRPSGGKRAGDKRRAERASQSQRPDGWEEQALAKFRALGEVPGNPAHAQERALAGLMVAWRQAETDPGLTPESRCRLLAALAPQIAKLTDIAKLNARIIELEAAMERLNGAQVASGPTGTA
jgi:hypothetical protein